MSVVVGFIPTPVGFAALECAQAQAARRGGPLIVVNIVRDGDDGDPRHALEAQLEVVHERTRHCDVRVDVRQERAEFGIAEALVEVVEQESAELLVIGIRREREVARHLLGATAQKLLIDAPCDVLVV